jgi:hypothetical protein
LSNESNKQDGGQVSEEREVVNKELLGNETKPCAICEIPKPKSELILVTGEVLGHAGGGNVDVCLDCYRSIQRGDVEPIGDLEF